MPGGGMSRFRFDSRIMSARVSACMYFLVHIYILFTYLYTYLYKAPRQRLDIDVPARKGYLIFASLYMHHLVFYSPGIVFLVYNNAIYILVWFREETILKFRCIVWLPTFITYNKTLYGALTRWGYTTTHITVQCTWYIQYTALSIERPLGIPNTRTNLWTNVVRVICDQQYVLRAIFQQYNFASFSKAINR
jgi:hypothetical protein